MNGLGRFEIHFMDGTGMRGLEKKCDVRMNIVMQHKGHGRKVERVLDNGIDVTEFAMQGLPV